IINIVNRYKIKFLGNFFIISDIGLIKNLKEFIPSLVSGTNLKKDLIIILILISILFLLFKKLFNIKNPPTKIRLLLFIISVFVVVFPILFPTPFNQILQKCKIETYIPNPIDNCKVNGILFCFYNDFKNINNPPPKDYTQAKINQIYSELKDLTSSREVLEQSERGGFSPNIIVIMSEAFWDVTNLTDVKYSDDPIKNVRKDIKSTFKSPSFGGGTANIEFELLTGLSNFYLKGTTPYSQVVKKTLPTLFTLFKNQGYLNTTIHPFFASMYNRKTVYKNFGLDNFISIENMTDYKTAGPYVSDDSFNKEIIKQLKSTDQQQLIFAISMQNHVTFKANRYSEHPITFKSSLNSNDQEILQSYVDGINLTDHSYAFLKQELSKSKKPTIIFFFGDHLTFLDSNYNIYKETGFNINDENKKRHTPLAVWSNYKTDINLPQNISPNFLSLEVLKSANITPKYQFSYLNSLISSGTVLNQKLPNKFTSEQLKDYELIQYDLIFGKQYSLKLVKP
ncbi:MAG: LTA synthase family protein, partial [Candidatus Shapirobacteria bacterium]